ncbi:hypothetical protein BDQ17DRAFT_1354531 [Cyathus striatus]|nr:hypothetical protein BDQ17DRAFT_1354531 [Cyathus striatus]
MSTEPLPNSVYEGLLTKLITVIQLTQQPDGVTTPQAKQVLLQATNDFRNSLAQAKQLAINLPGGELNVDEQDEIIEMLETIKRDKLVQLSQFANRVLRSSSSSAGAKTDVDSMASTPFEGL